MAVDVALVLVRVEGVVKFDLKVVVAVVNNPNGPVLGGEASTSWRTSVTLSVCCSDITRGLTLTKTLIVEALSPLSINNYICMVRSSFNGKLINNQCITRDSTPARTSPRLPASCKHLRMKEDSGGGYLSSTAVPGGASGGRQAMQRVQAQFLPGNIDLHDADPVLYYSTHAVMVANAFRTDLRIFFSLVNYSYSVYFSLIVLKLGLKLIKIIRSEINYPQTRKTVIVVFGGYQILLLGALGYSIAKRDEECFGSNGSIQPYPSCWPTASVW